MMGNSVGRVVSHRPMDYGNHWADSDSVGSMIRRSPMGSETIQGNSLKTWSLNEGVRGVEVTIETDGRPMHVTVELWGVGDHVKQAAQIYNEDGQSRPLTTYIDTPGGYNTICIRNTGEMAYPVRARVDMH
jgi:hypothetical protein